MLSVDVWEDNGCTVVLYVDGCESLVGRYYISVDGGGKYVDENGVLRLSAVWFNSLVQAKEACAKKEREVARWVTGGIVQTAVRKDNRIVIKDGPRPVAEFEL